MLLGITNLNYVLGIVVIALVALLIVMRVRSRRVG